MTLERPSVPPDDDASPGRPLLSIVLAFGAGLMLFVGLLFLTLGAAGLIGLIIVGVFAFAALHYLLWGWWLSTSIRDDVQEEERQAKP